MKLTISSASAVFQNPATTQNPQSRPNQEIMTQKDIQNLRDNIRQQIRAATDAQGRYCRPDGTGPTYATGDSAQHHGAE